MNELLAIAVGFGVYMFLGVVVHDYIIRSIYCRWKHKHKTKRKCYFWNCKDWQTCELNYDKRKG